MRKLALGLLLLGVVACTPPAPQPSPSPSPLPTPSTLPTPACFILEDQLWVGAPDSPTTMRSKVLAAMEAVGERCGQPPEQTLEVLANQLLAWGECSAKMTDSIFIQRHDDSGLYEEFHPVYYGNGCWTAAPLKGVWRRLRDPQ